MLDTYHPVFYISFPIIDRYQSTVFSCFGGYGPSVSEQWQEDFSTATTSETLIVKTAKTTSFKIHLKEISWPKEVTFIRFSSSGQVLS